MKRLAYLLITALLLAALPEIVSAQSNDPFEQQVIQSKGGKNEKRNKNRKKVTTEEVTPAPTPAPQPQQEDIKQPVNNMTISNSCSDWLDFELVSVIGSRGSQMVQLTVKITQHSTNQRMSVGGGLVAYDCDGVEHSRDWSAGGTFDFFTDVPVKTSFEIPGKINPNTTIVMPVISFKVGDCRIEMRNVTIDWR